VNELWLEMLLRITFLNHTKLEAYFKVWTKDHLLKVRSESTFIIGSMAENRHVCFELQRETMSPLIRRVNVWR
jgi:hypothetical protein